MTKASCLSFNIYHKNELSLVLTPESNTVSEEKKKVGMHRILFLPVLPAGYPADPKARYRISGRIQDIKKGRIIRPDIRCIPKKSMNLIS
jgi:hypothetical protein